MEVLLGSKVISLDYQVLQDWRQWVTMTPGREPLVAFNRDKPGAVLRCELKHTVVADEGEDSKSEKAGRHHCQ